jgi:hypothetical protein
VHNAVQMSATLNPTTAAPVALSAPDADVDLSFDLSFEDEVSVSVTFFPFFEFSATLCCLWRRLSAVDTGLLAFNWHRSHSPRCARRLFQRPAKSSSAHVTPTTTATTGTTAPTGTTGTATAASAAAPAAGTALPTGPFHSVESRLSPIVSAETEALMKRLRSTSGSVVVAAPTLVTATGAAGAPASLPPLLGLGGATSFSQMAGAGTQYSSSLPYPNSYGASPSFAELGLTKTAESLAASEGVTAEDANGIIVYGEPATPLDATALLEAITTLRLPGETLRHWHREGQHFCFVEFSRDVDTADVAKRISALTIGGVALSAEQCRRITPGRDPRTHRATSEFKSSTLVLKNLPFQLRQETLTDILNRMPCAPASINYHYDATGAFRGMAFVKYATVDDAYKVFNELNGLDIMNRALRVEYKRHSSTADGAAATGGSGGGGGGGAGSYKNGAHHGAHHHHGNHHGNQQHHHHQQAQRGAAPAAPAGAAGAAAPQLDPNELSADARAFYEQLIMFKQNSRLSELAFPPSLTVHQRKQLHYLAEQIGGLAHCAVGEGSARFLVVSKHPSPQMSTSSATLSAPTAAPQQQQQPHQPHRQRGGSNAGHNGPSSYSNAGNASYLSRSPGNTSGGSSSAAAFGARSWNERSKFSAGWGNNSHSHNNHNANSNHTNATNATNANANAKDSHGHQNGRSRGSSHSKAPSVHSPVGSPMDHEGTSAAAAHALLNDASLAEDTPIRPRSGTGDASNAVVRQPKGPSADSKGFTIVRR